MQARGRPGREDPGREDGADQGTGDLTRGLGAQCADTHQEVGQGLGIRRTDRAGVVAADRAATVARRARRIAVRLLLGLGPGQQGGALGAEGRVDPGEQVRDRAVPARRAREALVDQIQDVEPVQVVDPGRGRRVGRRLPDPDPVTTRQ
jgi:hypothetical protein